MNALELRRRTLGKGVYKKTVEGNPAIAQGSLARRYPGITMQGWTEQAQYEGKNLLPVDVGRRFTGADVRDSAVFAEDGVTVTFNDVQSGGRREIYLFGDNVNLHSESSYVDVPEITPGRYHTCNDSARIIFYVVVWRNGASVVLGSSTTSTIPITIEEGDKFRIFFACSNPGDGVQEYTIHPMLVKDGGELTTYEPYIGGQPSPNPDYPQEIVNAGKYNEDTQKWEYEITIANAQTDPDKNQTVTLTADRPLTKWDRLEKRDGVWGWVYKSGKEVIDGTETYSVGGSGYISEKSSNAYIDNNDMVKGIPDLKNGHCNRLTHVNAVWGAVDSIGFCYNKDQIHMRISNDSLGTTSESTSQEVISAMKNYMSQQYNDGNPFVFWYETEEETFVPLSESEQGQMNALYTFRPTTVLSNDCNCDMTLTYKTKKSLEVTT